MYLPKRVTKKLFVDYIKNKMSERLSGRIGSVMIRYASYLIDAILHGYVIRIGDIIKFSFVKISIEEYDKNYRIHFFQSNLTSDWLFFIDIECKIMERNHIMYIPTKKIERQIQNFIDSEKVYELIR